MAKIEKQGDKVTLEMTTQEALMLGELIERSGNVAARLARRAHDNRLVSQEADICMKQLWSLSDHLSIPDDPKHSYVQEFRLP